MRTPLCNLSAIRLSSVVINYLSACFVLLLLIISTAQAQTDSTIIPARPILPDIKPMVWSATRTPGSIAVNRDLKYQSMSPAELVQDIFVKTGACVNVSKVTTRIYGWDGSKWKNGNTGARGLAYFSAPDDCDFPIKQGLVLGTGNVHDAEGPNTSDQAMGNGSSGNGFIGGDSDLNGLLAAGYQTTDVGVLEFDFVPTGTIMEFKYIFASEEYPEYANSPYNDVFGFFVNKVTPTAGPKQNIALLPSSTTSDYVVSINNVNNGAWSNNNYNTPHASYSNTPKNQTYFVKNLRAGVTTEFDGYTKVLTARFENMEPCETYHLKLAVANVRDFIYGSAVFLQAHSFDAGQSLSVYGNKIEGVEYVFKNCDQNFFRVIRTELNTQDVTVQLDYEGAAINGTHYTALDGTKLPTTITFAPTEYYKDIWFKATPAATHGSSFKVKLWCPCADMNIAATKNIYIYENYKSTFSSAVASSCSGLNNGAITLTGSGSSGEYEFSLNGGTWQKTTGGSYTFSGLSPGTYTVRARDYGSCVGAYPTPISVILQNLTANAGPDQVQCLSGASSFTMAANQYSAPARETGKWTVVSSVPSGFSALNIVNTAQYNTVVNVPQAYSSVTLRWTLTSPAGCSDYDNVILRHYPQFLFSETVTAHKNVSCNGGNDGSVTVVASGGSGSGYQYSKDNLIWSTGNIFAGLTAGTYTFYAKDAGGCTANISVTITEPSVLNLTKITHTNVTCYGGNNGSVSVIATGGTSPYQYRIGGGLWGATATFGTLSANTYTVEVRDSKGCTETLSATITQPALLNFTTTKTDVLCNGGSTGNITVNATGGTAPYTYSINSGTFGLSNIFNSLQAGTYNIQVKDSKNCSSAIKQVTIIQGGIILDPSDVNAPLACPNVLAKVNINNSKIGALYKVYDSPSGGNLISSKTGTGGNISLDAGTYQHTTNIYIETVDGTCISVGRITVTITIRETMINYPDLRIQVCPGGGNINLSKYIDTLDIVSLTWSGVSVGTAPVTAAGIVNSNNFSFPGTYVYRYKIASHCSPADVERLLYATTLNDRTIGLPPDTIVVCKDYADHLNLNNIFGIEAGGTWRTVPTSTAINAFIKHSPVSSPYAGAVVFDGKGAYSLLTNTIYHGVASKKIEFYYKSAIGSCLGGKEYKLVIILTSDITV